MKEIIKLKVVLERTAPPIWRTILIPNSITFFDLHHILQIAMGWKNSHLFDFNVGDYSIGFLDDDAPEDLADASEVTVDTLLTTVGMKFRYTYDFGDSWRHALVVEELLDREPDQLYPVCLDGEMNCPPEDCGGIPGFENMLAILRDRTHPEFQEMYAWAGRYNPNKFNKEKINKELPAFKKYRKRWKK
jgi:hypothetical protein